MYKAVIFDLDGTILDTLKDLESSLNYALTSCGFPKRETEEIRSFLGNGIIDLVWRSAPTGTSEEKRQKVIDQFNSHYAVHCKDFTGPYAGILDLLKALKEEGIAAAVVSNKPNYAVQELCLDYFPGLFAYATGVKDGIARKPSPDLVYEALEVLQCKAEEAVYIGDSEVDLKTAAAASMPCISVSWGFRDEEHLIEAGAKEIAKSAAELKQMIFQDK